MDPIEILKREQADTPARSNPSMGVEDLNPLLRYFRSTEGDRHLDPDSLNKLSFHVLFANVTADVGGAEQVILSLAERLPAHGISVSFALFRPGPLEDILRSRGIKVHVFNSPYRFRDLASLWRCTKWLADCIRADGANILHSNLTAHLIGGWAARMANIPELWHLHDYPFKFDPVHSINRLIPANYYLFTTEFLKSGEPRLRRQRNTVINPDCIDVAKIRATRENSSIREQLGVRSGAYFLTVARLQEHKGHIYLIEAAIKVAAAYPDIKWVIAGRATGKEQLDYLNQLKDQIGTAKLEDRILLAGFVADRDMVSLFRGAIALVHAAVTEGYGLVLLEAMAHSLPVIAAAASGPVGIIEDEVNGLLVPVRDSDALAAAMTRLMEDSSLPQLLSQEAERSVAERSIDRMVEKTLAVYCSMLGVP